MIRYLIWGTGRIAQRNLKRFQLAYSNGEAEIIGFIDSNAENGELHLMSIKFIRRTVSLVLNTIILIYGSWRERIL